jgi:predicted RNA-binding protein (virulence factor B family)
MEFKAGDKVNIKIGVSTDIGYKVSVEGDFIGMVYHNEIFRPLKEGSDEVAYVKKIREDGRLDLSLQPQGFRNVIALYSDSVMEQLKLNKGVIKLSDQSSPEEIYSQLKISKKAFKSAIGSLYKLKKIRIEKDAIYLLK